MEHRRCLIQRTAFVRTVDGDDVGEMTVVGRSFGLLSRTVPVSQLVDDLVVGAQFHLDAVRSAQPDDEHAAFRLPVPDVAQHVHLAAQDHRVARRQLDVHRVLLTGHSSAATTTYDDSILAPFSST